MRGGKIRNLGERVTGAIINYGRGIKQLLQSPKGLDERVIGATHGESEQTEAELMEQELSPVWSRLCERLKGLENCLQSPDINNAPKEEVEKDLANLKSFLDTVVSASFLDIVVSRNTEGTEGSETMIRIAFEKMIQTAFKYIQQFGRDNDRSKLLAVRVVHIADELKEAVHKIAFRRQFSYEKKADFLNGLISLMVELILNIDPEFRGRKPKISNFDHPNNALLTTLDRAAYVLLDEAATKAKELNNPQELIGAISSLLEMTKKLRPDELKRIYDKILLRIYLIIMNLVAEKKVIDDNLIEQLANWYANYFAKHEDTFDQFVNQLLNRIPPHLELEKILSGKLAELDPKHWDMASRLNRNIRLEKRIEGLKEEIAGLKRRNTRLEEDIAKLRRELTELRTQVQILVNSNRNSN